MQHVRITTITGPEAEITHEEAMRIVKEFSKPSMDEFHEEVKERNWEYLEKAEMNISDIAARHGIFNVSTEDDIKELLAYVLEVDQSVANLIVEIIEQRIGTHHKKIYSV